MAKLTDREFKVKVRKGMKAKPTRRHRVEKAYRRSDG